MSCMAQPEHRQGVARLAEQAQEAQTNKVEQMEGESMMDYYCMNCFEKHYEEELTDGFCEECIENEIDQYKYDIDGCYELGEKCKEDISINGFLLSMFAEDEIEAILYRHLKDASLLAPVDCTPFIESDKSWFEDEVIAKMKGGK